MVTQLALILHLTNSLFSSNISLSSLEIPILFTPHPQCPPSPILSFALHHFPFSLSPVPYNKKGKSGFLSFRYPLIIGFFPVTVCRVLQEGAASPKVHINSLYEHDQGALKISPLLVWVGGYVRTFSILENWRVVLRTSARTLYAMIWSALNLFVTPFPPFPTFFIIFSVDAYGLVPKSDRCLSGRSNPF